MSAGNFDVPGRETDTGAKCGDRREHAANSWDRVWRPGGEQRQRPVAWRAMKSLRDAIVPYPSPVNYFARAWLQEWVSLPEMNVMEIGGAGGLGLLLSPQCRRYTLLDYSQEALAAARQVLQNCPNAACVLSDMFDYVPSDPIDLIISIGLIEHFFGEDQERCLQAHARLSERYVCVGAPADIPVNWWRHFRFHTTKEYPDQRPISERELFNLCLRVGLTPIAMTRLDPRYGRHRRRLETSLYSCFSAWWPCKRWAWDREDGGIVMMLAEKSAQGAVVPSPGPRDHTMEEA